GEVAAEISIVPTAAADDVEGGEQREVHGAGGVRWLDRGGDAELPKARHVGAVDQLDMLDPVAAVALAVRALRGLVAVDGGTDGAVADGVDGDLHAAPVDLGGDLVEPL